MTARLLRGRYEPLETLGAGGQGRVLRALDTQHGRFVAIKVRDKGSARREDLLREARVLLELPPHPGVPLVREDFFEDDAYFLVMDWVEGRSLRQILAERGGAGVPLDEALPYLADVAAALDHLHSQQPPVVHKDVKPENIIMTRRGRAVLVDFGIAGYGAAREPGTAEFTAPEVIAGEPAGPHSDVYSLAVTAHTVLTGASPSPGRPASPPGTAPAVAQQISAALARGLAFDAATRPGSAGELLALLSPRRVRNNLPASFTSFVGRRRETAQLKDVLTRSRLVTLTGAGGSGKTRLAVEVSRELLFRFVDGVWLVELSGLWEPDLLAAHTAAAIGLMEVEGAAAIDLLLTNLRDRQVLLIVDNCEHLLEGIAALVRRLLEACPDLRVLATSREPLGMTGESVLRLSSLDVPDVDATDVHRSDAVLLFADRARAADPDFSVEDDPRAIANITRRLDGIPLALEMAASRVASMRPAELAASLDHRFQNLEGSRAALPRHRTLRATVDWSFDLLDAITQTLFRRLAVFAGGFTTGDVDDICAPVGAGGSTAALLARLADVSLITRDERGPEPRWILLESIRDYASERLGDAGELPDITARHASYFTRLAETAVPRLQYEDASVWSSRLRASHDNLRAALAWALDNRPADAMRLAASLWPFWLHAGHWSEGRSLLERVLSVDDDDETALARARLGLGVLAEQQGERKLARELMEAARSRFGAAGDRRGEAEATYYLGHLVRSGGELGGTTDLFEEVHAISQEVGDDRLTARALFSLGDVAQDRGDFDAAASLYSEATRILEQTGDRRGLADALISVSVLAQNTGDAKEALLCERALSICREIGDRSLGATAAQSVAVMLLRLGRPDDARVFCEQALEYHEEVGDRAGVGDSLGNLARVATATGDLREAATLYEMAAAAGRDTSAVVLVFSALFDLSLVYRRLGDEDAEARTVAEALEVARSWGHVGALTSALERAVEVAEGQARTTDAALLSAELADLRHRLAGDS